MPVDSISHFLDLQTMGEVLESGWYCPGFCWAALQTMWHLKKSQDILAVKDYSFVTFMLPYSLFHIVIPRVAAQGLSMLCLKSVQSLRNRVACVNSVTG